MSVNVSLHHYIIGMHVFAYELDTYSSCDLLYQKEKKISYLLCNGETYETANKLFFFLFVTQLKKGLKGSVLLSFLLLFTSLLIMKKHSLLIRTYHKNFSLCSKLISTLPIILSFILETQFTRHLGF